MAARDMVVIGHLPMQDSCFFLWLLLSTERAFCLALTRS